MLSVLIPTYKWNSFPLIKKIHEQLIKEGVLFEIIVIDDASNSPDVILNEKTNILSNATFEVLEKNIGRSAIRNLLATKANYKWLLFFDADVMMDDDFFIHKYLQVIKSNTHDIIVGGMYYKKAIGKDTLRFKFGKEREEVPTEKRNLNPFRYLFSANFLIKKEVFDTVIFNETLEGYGYEDLLFSMKVKDQNFSLLHIKNPIYHLEIDSNEVFVNKTKEGFKNLTKIMTSNVSIEDIRILKVLKKYNFLVMFLSFFNTFYEQRAIRRSSLFFYDLFRISSLYKIRNNRGLK